MVNPMLADLQTYIAKRGTVSVTDLSLHFGSDSQAIKPMLHKLSRKGRIRQLPAPTKCGGCTSCDANTVEFYEWRGEEPPHLTTLQGSTGKQCRC